MNQHPKDNHYAVAFNIRGYWHAGSGRGSGFAVNALVARDHFGLPFLPGRTVKGLLRDAAWRAEHLKQLAPGRTALWFGLGTSKPGTDPQTPRITRYETQQGQLQFENAHLPDDLRHWLAAPEQQACRQALFRTIHATAIDPHQGQAKAKSLRSYEVAIPLTLSSWITVQDTAMLATQSPDWPAELGRCLCLLRGLGLARNRGLGRVEVQLQTVEGGTLENTPF